MSAIATTDARSLKPATDAEIYDALEPMFLGFGRDIREIGQKRVSLYVDAARGEPVWSVREVSLAIATGRADTEVKTRLPHPAEWGDLLRRYTRPYREAIRRAETQAKERARLDREEREARESNPQVAELLRAHAAKLRNAGKSL